MSYMFYKNMTWVWEKRFSMHPNIGWSSYWEDDFWFTMLRFWFIGGCREVGLFSRFTYSTLNLFLVSILHTTPLRLVGLCGRRVPKGVGMAVNWWIKQKSEIWHKDFGKVGVRLNHIQTRKQSSKDGKLVVLYLEFHYYKFHLFIYELWNSFVNINLTDVDIVLFIQIL